MILRFFFVNILFLISTQVFYSQAEYEIEKTDLEWREQLDEMSYLVLRKAYTERPFTGKYDNFYDKGTYHCAGCDAKLFESEFKYDSGSGWPSFFHSIENVFETKEDMQLGYKRIEYHCKNCGGHHGHIFDDGPEPTGKRYCNNGLCLVFKPR